MSNPAHDAWIKATLGLDPAKASATAPPLPPAPPDKQSQEFRAQFTAALAPVDAAIAYLSLHADEAKKAAVASKREVLVTIYTAALAKVDPADEAKGKPALGQALNGVGSVAAEAGAAQRAAEKVFADWTAREPKLEQAARKIEEMEDWGYDKAATLRTQLDAVKGPAEARSFEVASAAVDQVLGASKPLIGDYENQKAAKATYEPARDALADRLAKASGNEHPKLQVESDEAGAERDVMEASAKEQNFVQALEQLGDLTKKLEAFEAALDEIERKKKEFEALKLELELKLTPVQQSTYRKLEPKQQEIAAGKTAVDAAAAAEEYDQATTLASELANKCEEYEAEAKKLDEERKAYETAWAALQPRYEQTATSEFKTLQTLQEELLAIKASIDSSVQAEDFAQALTQVNDLATKVDTFLAERDKLQQQRSAYDEIWATVGPKVTEALQGSSTRLAPQREALAATQQQVDAAVQGEQFEQAGALATDLGAKADTYLEAERLLAEQKLRYETELSTLQGELDAVAKSGSPALAAFNEEIARIRAQMEQAAQAEDYEQALAHAEDLSSKVKTYLDELAKARADYEAKLAPIEAGMKDVTDCGYSAMEARKAEVTGAYDAMVKLAQAEDYKAASDAADKLSPKISDFGAQRARAAGVVQQKIYPRLNEIAAGMKEFDNEKSPLKDDINALIDSIRLRTAQGDAEFEAAANDMDRLSSLFDQLKSDPCLKAKRSPDYVKAVQAEAQARADAKPLWTTLEKARLDYLKPLAGQGPDPNQDLIIKQAEEAVRAAELKKFQAVQEVNRVLASFSCPERIEERRLDPGKFP